MTLTVCGPGSSGSADSEALVKVFDFGRVFSIDDVLVTGWKRSKTYDVEDLKTPRKRTPDFGHHLDSIRSTTRFAFTPTTGQL
jgi:hypothetical protein